MGRPASGDPTWQATTVEGRTVATLQTLISARDFSSRNWSEPLAILGDLLRLC